MGETKITCGNGHTIGEFKEEGLYISHHGRKITIARPTAGIVYITTVCERCKDRLTIGLMAGTKETMQIYEKSD